jgi:hypothetical protein
MKYAEEIYWPRKESNHYSLVLQYIIYSLYRLSHRGCTCNLWNWTSVSIEVICPSRKTGRHEDDKQLYRFKWTTNLCILCTITRHVKQLWAVWVHYKVLLPTSWSCQLSVYWARAHNIILSRVSPLQGLTAHFLKMSAVPLLGQSPQYNLLHSDYVLKVL